MSYTETIALTSINCGQCGGTYSINERYRAERQENGGTWHCPYCQVSWGYSESELKRTQKALEQAQIDLRKSKCDLLVEKIAREGVEKKLRRVKKGLCPCCNRFFSNLARHMATKHNK